MPWTRNARRFLVFFNQRQMNWSPNRLGAAHAAKPPPGQIHGRDFITGQVEEGSDYQLCILPTGSSAAALGLCAAQTNPSFREKCVFLRMSLPGTTFRLVIIGMPRLVPVEVVNDANDSRCG